MSDAGPLELQAEQECPAGRIRVETDASAMRAALSLFPAAGGPPFTKDEILAALALARVVRGVDGEALTRVIGEVECAGLPLEHRLVAAGRPPQPGRNAGLEYPPLRRPAGGEPLPSDPVEATRANVINVMAGEAIALYHPLVDGVPGVNVRGEYVPIAPGADTTPRPGRNVRRDGARYVALADGRLVVEKNQVLIDEHLVIDGDLTVLQGDLEFVGMLQIRGEIESGLRVHGHKDILVGGSILGSSVVCGGNLRVRNGIVGNGDTRIEVHGDLEAEFVENVELVVRGQCQINKSLVNAHVLCGQTLTMPGYGHIVSGQIYARDGIRAAEIGVVNGATVKLVVGMDAIASRRVVEIDREFDRTEERLRKVKGLLADFGPDRPAYAKLAPQRRAEVDQMVLVVQQLDEARMALEEERNLVMRQMKKNNEATITVRREVHVDTIIQFPYDGLVVRTPARRVTYVFDMQAMRIATQSLAA